MKARELSGAGGMPPMEGAEAALAVPCRAAFIRSLQTF